jgi:hypothetical protein
VYKFVSTDCTPVAQINEGRDTIADCGSGSLRLSVPEGAGASYEWTLDGNPFATDSASVTVTQGGQYVVTVTNNNCISTDSVYFTLSSALNPNFTGLDTLYCVYNNAVTLIPDTAGGIFAGPGVSNDVFTPSTAGAGIHHVTYTLTDQYGCVFDSTQTVRVDLCLGVEPAVWSKSLAISPNPNHGSFVINGYSETGRYINTIIYNSTGAKVYEETFAVGSGMLSVNMNVNLPAGIYFVQMSSHNEAVTLKLNIR